MLTVAGSSPPYSDEDFSGSTWPTLVIGLTPVFFAPTLRFGAKKTCVRRCYFARALSFDIIRTRARSPHLFFSAPRWHRHRKVAPRLKKAAPAPFGFGCYAQGAAPTLSLIRRTVMPLYAARQAAKRKKANMMWTGEICFFPFCSETITVYITHLKSGVFSLLCFHIAQSILLGFSAHFVRFTTPF